MLISLELNKRKLGSFNKKLKTSSVYGIDKTVKTIEDVFGNYTSVSKELSERYRPVETDYIDIENTLCYVQTLTHGKNLIDDLTNVKTVSNLSSPIAEVNHGSADNLSQIIELYDRLNTEHSDYMVDRNFVILIEPLIRENCSPTFKWKHAGKYIGKYEKTSEFFAEEDDVDFIYLFKIWEVK